MKSNASTLKYFTKAKEGGETRIKKKTKPEKKRRLYQLLVCKGLEITCSKTKITIISRFLLLFLKFTITIF